MTFGEKLRELRDAVGLSEAKLAAKAGVSFGAVHNYGLGFRQPTFSAVVKIARALGVTCEAFADCTDIAGLEPEAEPEPEPEEKPKKKSKGKGKK